MKMTENHLRKIIKRLIENELHVFDFDETLGTTPASTNLAAVKYLGGDPHDFKNNLPLPVYGTELNNGG